MPIHVSVFRRILTSISQLPNKRALSRRFGTAWYIGQAPFDAACSCIYTRAMSMYMIYEFLALCDTARIRDMNVSSGDDKEDRMERTGEPSVTVCTISSGSEMMTHAYYSRFSLFSSSLFLSLSFTQSDSMCSRSC